MKSKIRKVLFSNGFLALLAGIFLSSALHFRTESRYEDALFEALVDRIKLNCTEPNNPDSLFLCAMRLTHQLEESRMGIFGGVEIKGVKSKLFRPASMDLMTGDGACGSYATVLSRILKAGGYEVRIAQMTVNGRAAGHMVVEARKRSSWVVMDPMFKQFFKKPDGSLASFADVSGNWKYYGQQTVPGYVDVYRYEGVRYTNWERFPLLGKATTALLRMAKGKEFADGFSVRSLLLRKYDLLFRAAAAAFFMLLGWWAFTIYNTRKFSA